MPRINKNFCHLASEVSAIGAERRDVSWRGKKGVVTSAHPLNHHSQGRGVKTHMEMTFLKRSAMAAFFDSRTCRCHLLALLVVIFVENKEAIWHQYFI